jgi:hypothetical protein
MNMIGEMEDDEEDDGTDYVLSKKDSEAVHIAL